jgi:hypothetical protein
MSRMKAERAAPIIFATLAMPALLFAVYMGGYYAMIDPKQLGWKELPIYRVDSVVLDRVLWPAHTFDLRLRPDYWPDLPMGGCIDFDTELLVELESTSEGSLPPPVLESVILE